MRSTLPPALYFATLIAVIAGSGCATIVSGTNERVLIDSAPPGANVSIDAVERGHTPVELDLARGTPHKIAFKKSGYTDKTVVTTNTLNGWFFGNVLLGGLIGMIVDFSSGAASSISPNPVAATLTEEPIVEPARRGEDGEEKAGTVPVPRASVNRCVNSSGGFPHRLLL